MLFRIICPCGHEGFANLPRRLRCCACGASKYVKTDDGIQLQAPEEPDAEAEAEQLEADTADWIRAYRDAVQPWRDPTMA